MSELLDFINSIALLIGYVIVCGTTFGLILIGLLGLFKGAGDDYSFY